MLLQYNFQNSNNGPTKVNVIYGKNQTLSKVIINGQRFHINYPIDLSNKLSSNVLVVQKIKFGDPNKNKSPNSNSMELNVNKIKKLTKSNDNKIIYEKEALGYINKLNFKFINKKPNDDPNAIINVKDIEKYEYECSNRQNYNNLNKKNYISPILNVPSNFAKNKILPSLPVKNSSYSVSRNPNLHIISDINTVKENNFNMEYMEKNPEMSPQKLKMNLLKKIKYIDHYNNNSINLGSPRLNENNNGQILEEKNSSDKINLEYYNKLKIDNSPNFKKIDITKNDKNLSNLNNSNSKIYIYLVRPGNNPDMIRRCFNHRLNWRESGSIFTTVYNFKWGQTKKGMEYSLLNKKNVNKKIVNHFEFEPEISNKKYMFANFLEYCDKNNLNAFDYLPFTIIAKINSSNYKEHFKNFSDIFNNIQKYVEKCSLSKNNNDKSHKKKENYGDLFKNEINDYKISSQFIKIPESHYNGNNLWLIKPTDLWGGRCIQITDNLEELEKFVKKFFDGMERSLKKSIDEDEETSDEEEINDEEKIKKGSGTVIGPGTGGVKYRASTVLIQKYIESPFLYFGRKFDLRMWVLINHKLEVFMFKEGHLKTTSTEYRTDSKDKFIHITNYSLQKYNNNFNKYEEGNEVSFKDFQEFLDKQHQGQKISMKNDFYPQMIEIIKLSTLSIKDKINKKKRQFCYVTLGYDFMIDSNLKVWLIEINKNPGLCESSNIIKMLIPRMIDDSLRLTLDDIFEPKYNNNDPNNYKSPFQVEGYEDTENMWMYLHTLIPNDLKP